MTGSVINTDSKYPDYPLQQIKEPGAHDVMCGRGGGTNNHSGNIRFRQLVNEHKLRYLAATKVDKPKVAREVVGLWRSQSPPGRFLTKTKSDSVSSKDALWHDVGDQKAREKASQCLRERTPDVLPFVQSLSGQASGKKTSKKESSGVKADRVESDNGEPRLRHPGENIDPRIQQLHRLHLLQQQQQKLMALQAARGAAVPPQTHSSVDFDATGTPSPEAVMEYLKRASAPAGNFEFDDQSINPNGSAREIAAALFGKCGDKDIPEGDLTDADREAMMEVMSKTSWVQSFTSLDSEMLSAHSLGKIAADETKSSANMGPPPNRDKDMKKAKQMNSNMSMISELTDYDGRSAMLGSIGQNRSGKMKDAKGMNSNVSMMSELTDMTGDFSKMGIEEED
eukprot:CAMPEP_0172516654 /NCGR_PEP_ID=MMETSP1066-20121228/278018_1 /TAXON_ID=671091 /ORGANISM="Coscinodiscus wailesii, Strain CCMP2513" /LENGTH=395 /DNA_ID=CAMNT_0013298227 /DNA_START=87 /DNA_END=1274 /DNA_ORIENTATION=-